MDNDIQQCRESIRQHSKSFSLAARLLPLAYRDDAAAVYAWCRRADDAIDEPAGDDPRASLTRLRRELATVYEGDQCEDPVLSAFQRVVIHRKIPLQYPCELLAGMEMDLSGYPYRTWQDTLLYCHRVASTVGLMMCHVLGVSDPRALGHAADLGIAMQLTNICRDVREDWQRGRLYLPNSLLERHGGHVPANGGAALQDVGTAALAAAVRSALSVADEFYESGRVGLRYLSWHGALAVDVARRVYSGIGDEISARECDVLLPRAFVPRWKKLWICGAAAGAALGRLVRGVHGAPTIVELPPFVRKPVSIAS